MDTDTKQEQLQWALQALAIPAEQQVGCFPWFVSVPDELVLDFDRWYQDTLQHVQFSAEQ